MGVGMGVAVPALLFGGVIGASMGVLTLYAGAIQEGLCEDTEGIFSEAPPAGAVTASVKAHSVAELRNPVMRGFLASRS